MQPITVKIEILRFIKCFIIQETAKLNFTRIIDQVLIPSYSMSIYLDIVKDLTKITLYYTSYFWSQVVGLLVRRAIYGQILLLHLHFSFLLMPESAREFEQKIKKSSNGAIDQTMSHLSLHPEIPKVDDKNCDYPPPSSFNQDGITLHIIA